VPPVGEPARAEADRPSSREPTPPLPEPPPGFEWQGHRSLVRVIRILVPEADQQEVFAHLEAEGIDYLVLAENSEGGAGDVVATSRAAPGGTRSSRTVLPGQSLSNVSSGGTNVPTDTVYSETVATRSRDPTSTASGERTIPVATVTTSGMCAGSIAIGTFEPAV